MYIFPDICHFPFCLHGQIYSCHALITFVESKSPFSVVDREQTLLGQISINSYFKDELFKASERLVAAANEAGMTGHAAALRWVVHHSQLKPEYGDAVLLGASSVEQLKSNLDSAEAGPLPDGLRAVFEELWPMVKDAAPPYWMASPASGVDSSSAKS